jgi:hypothetical protein
MSIIGWNYAIMTAIPIWPIIQMMENPFGCARALGLWEIIG